VSAACGSSADSERRVAALVEEATAPAALSLDGCSSGAARRIRCSASAAVTKPSASTGAGYDVDGDDDSCATPPSCWVLTHSVFQWRRGVVEAQGRLGGHVVEDTVGSG
jgi:hypothetical protein